MNAKLIEETSKFIFSVFDVTTSKFYTIFKDEYMHYSVGTDVGLSSVGITLDEVFKFISPELDHELEIYFENVGDTWDEVEEWYGSRNQTGE